MGCAFEFYKIIFINPETRVSPFSLFHSPLLLFPCLVVIFLRRASPALRAWLIAAPHHPASSSCAVARSGLSSPPSLPIRCLPRCMFLIPHIRYAHSPYMTIAPAAPRGAPCLPCGRGAVCSLLSHWFAQCPQPMPVTMFHAMPDRCRQARRQSAGEWRGGLNVTAMARDWH